MPERVDGGGASLAARDAWIRERALVLAGIRVAEPPRVLRDSSNFMSIDRGDVLELGGQLYLVVGNEREGRFGIDDQPKYWVKRARSLQTGAVHILKLQFHESFATQVGELSFASERSAAKEARVLEAVAGHPNFMHGQSVHDTGGNLVRVLEFIEGETLLQQLGRLGLSHAQYAQELLPSLLAELFDCVQGIAELHRQGLCHGDIRNDHILMDAASGRGRWIDFDFDRDALLFDVWSLGNVLNCVAAKGFVTYHHLQRAQPELLALLDDGDGSVFFRHRVMNVHRLYPYLPASLGRMLERYARGGRVRYERVEQVVEDLGACLQQQGWQRRARQPGAPP